MDHNLCVSDINACTCMHESMYTKWMSRYKCTSVQMQLIPVDLVEEIASCIFTSNEKMLHSCYVPVVSLCYDCRVWCLVSTTL